MTEKARITHIGMLHEENDQLFVIGWAFEGGPGLVFSDDGKVVTIGGYTAAELKEIYRQHLEQGSDGQSLPTRDLPDPEHPASSSDAVGE